MPPRRRNQRETKLWARNKFIRIGHLWEMQTGEAQLSPKDPVGYSFIMQGEWGSEKTTSSFLGVVAPPKYPVRCVFKSAEGQSSNSCPWSEPECRTHPILHPTTWGKSPACTSQANLPCSDGFLKKLLTHNDSSKYPRFLSLSMVPYWDFCNYMCLLHPYHIHSHWLAQELNCYCFCHLGC